MTFSIDEQKPVSFAQKKVLIIAPHPDDEVIGCGALLLYLSHRNNLMLADQRPKNISVAYAVSGFNGVSDCFLHENGFSLAAMSDSEKRAVKTEIRRQEIDSLARYLKMTSYRLQLPFYEEQRKFLTETDQNVVDDFFRVQKPDIVFLIDEANDPHGTHGMVRQLFLQYCKNKETHIELFGYRVWDHGYTPTDFDFSLAFNERVMQKKEKLLCFYESQLKSPAFPHQTYTFLELMKLSNKKMAMEHAVSLPFLEVYKRL